MIEIKDLLGKWSNVLASGELKKESIRNIISQVIGVGIKLDDIDIQKNGSVYLNIKPIYKNEILLKKDRINSLLEETLGNKAPKDFR